MERDMKEKDGLSECELGRSDWGWDSNASFPVSVLALGLCVYSNYISEPVNFEVQGPLNQIPEVFTV
jgi:hypothetical protein